MALTIMACYLDVPIMTVPELLLQGRIYRPERLQEEAWQVIIGVVDPQSLTFKGFADLSRTHWISDPSLMPLRLRLCPLSQSVSIILFKNIFVCLMFY